MDHQTGSDGHADRSRLFFFSSFGPSHFRNTKHPLPQYTCSFPALLCLKAQLFRMSVSRNDAHGMGSQERLLASLLGWKLQSLIADNAWSERIRMKSTTYNWIRKMVSWYSQGGAIQTKVDVLKDIGDAETLIRALFLKELACVYLLDRVSVKRQ